jgi:hypothetical protein
MHEAFLFLAFLLVSQCDLFPLEQHENARVDVRVLSACSCSDSVLKCVSSCSSSYGTSQQACLNDRDCTSCTCLSNKCNVACNSGLAFRGAGGNWCSTINHCVSCSCVANSCNSLFGSADKACQLDSDCTPAYTTPESVSSTVPPSSNESTT